jgi:hypothetical protein
MRTVMTTRHLLAIALLGGCTDPVSETGPGAGGAGGGKSDDPNAVFKDVVTEWEFPVGYGGDAVVNEVSILPGGSLLVTSSFPRWLRKLTADGMRDTTWGSQSPGSSQRSGFLGVPAHEVWQVGNQMVAAGGDGALFYLYGYLADGSPNPGFGTAGRVDLPYNDGKPLRVAYDQEGERFLVVVARAWESTSWFTKGPSKIELLAYDQQTGAMSSAGIHDLPSWDNTGTNPARVHELVVQPDGSRVLIVSETVHTSDPSRADVATQWSTIRLDAGQPPVVTRLAVTSYNARVAGFADLGGGHFDLYLSGTVDGISMAYNEGKLVRISVDDAGVSDLEVLGPGLDFTKGCPASVATATHLVFGQSLDRSLPIQFTAYPRSGAPITFESDLPKRCLTGLTVAPNGHLYAGTWDTTNVGWTAQLSSLAPN